ncbi:hypothetical protein DL766_002849 [Monosporascus sp. MC13-8B]|nr:hypothetical protein DL763_000518 [Monosporascus cannonballus]RYP34736.1 hypothetical protein DL766_002849 [Monosporascus sp. MC13-8B]
MALVPAIVLLSLVLFALHLRKEISYRRRIPAGARRLPGPKCRVHDIPEQSWLKFYEWNKEYGPIYQMEMFGDVHIWISSEKIAHELLSRRAPIYSDRPVIPNLPDNRTSGDYLALQGRTDTWKRQRKLATQLMAVSANAALHKYPTAERDRFLYLLSRNPSQYREAVEQFTTRTISRLSWGSPYPAAVLRETTMGLLETISPAGALPNVIPWLAHLPAFLSPWQRKENARHAREAALFKGNVRYVHDRLEEGSAKPSFVRTYIATLAKSPADAAKWGSEAEATYVVGQMAIAGALTIGAPIQSFILAMLHYPEWLKKLQDEIDRVCDDGRCPQWEDREKLHMLRAVVKEVIRWRPPVPTGIPHALEKDDVYEGYFIPAGATIHALEWGMTRNEETYPDPETFNPDRWLNPKYPTYKEPLTVYPNLNGFSQFGFGRRTCQGVPIVDQDLFLVMGGLAWAFNIRKKRRPDGTEVPVHWNDNTPLLIAKPKPFEFDVEVRDDQKRDILQRMWEDARWEDDEVEDTQTPVKKNMVTGKNTSRATLKKEMIEEGDVGSHRGSETSNDGIDTGEALSSVHSTMSLSDIQTTVE